MNKHFYNILKILIKRNILLIILILCTIEQNYGSNRIHPDEIILDTASKPFDIRDPYFMVSGGYQDLILNDHMPPSTPRRELTEDEKVDLLQQAIDTTKTKLANSILPGVSESIIFLGPTGHGKSTLALLLKGDALNLISQYGLNLLGQTNASNTSAIEHSLTHSGTRIPNSYYVSSPHNMILWDCPGFGDLDQGTQSIINAFSIFEVCNLVQSTKIVLVVNENALITRSANVIQLFNDITASFGNAAGIEQLKNLVVLAITARKNLDFNPFEVIKEMGRDFNNSLHLASRTLINHLITSQHYTFMDAPIKGQEYSSYTVRSKILDALNQIEFGQLPSRQVVISGDSLRYINRLIQKINMVIKETLENNKSAIIAHIKEIAHNFNGRANNLRESIIYRKNRLEELRYITDEEVLRYSQFEEFSESVKNLIRSKIEAIQTLMRIVPAEDQATIRWFDLQNWFSTLSQPIRLLEVFGAPPASSYENDILTIKGLLIGTSDINAAINLYPNATSFYLFGLNTLWIDEDIRRNGKKIAFISPKLKIMGEREIDVSGSTGDLQNPTVANMDINGIPGLPGKNGGHVYGKGHEFINFSLLSIRTNGGTGGPGQHGGNGSKGNDGANGHEEETSREPFHRFTNNETAHGNYREWLGAAGEHETTVTGTSVYYNANGGDGNQGNRGGKGGKGGQGGYKGSVFFEGLTEQLYQHDTQTNNRGGTGMPGNPGEPGIGGTHGKHHRGHLITGARARYEIWKKTGPFGWGRETEHHDDALSDRWEVSKHHEGERGSASKGTRHTELNDVDPQDPSSQAPLNIEDILNAYTDFYNSRKTDVLTNSFIIDF